MKESWWIGFIMAFVLCSIVFGVAEMQYLGGSGTSNLEVLFFARIGQYQDASGWIGGTITGLKEWIENLWDMFWWNYAGLDGEWSIVKWVLLYPISLGLIISIILSRIGSRN